MHKLYDETRTLIEKTFINKKEEKILIPKGTEVRIIDILNNEWCIVEFINDLDNKFPHTSDYRLIDLE